MSDVGHAFGLCVFIPADMPRKFLHPNSVVWRHLTKGGSLERCCQKEVLRKGGTGGDYLLRQEIEVLVGQSIKKEHPATSQETLNSMAEVCMAQVQIRIPFHSWKGLSLNNFSRSFQSQPHESSSRLPQCTSSTERNAFANQEQCSMNATRGVSDHAVSKEKRGWLYLLLTFHPNLHEMILCRLL